jgi:hypothetical protein
MQKEQFTITIICGMLPLHKMIAKMNKGEYGCNKTQKLEINVVNEGRRL